MCVCVCVCVYEISYSFSDEEHAGSLHAQDATGKSVISECGHSQCKFLVVTFFASLLPLLLVPFDVIEAAFAAIVSRAGMLPLLFVLLAFRLRLSRSSVANSVKHLR